MRGTYKKIVSAFAICAMMIAGAWVVSRDGWYADGSSARQETAEEEGEERQREAYMQAQTDLVFWYDDASYEPFYLLAAERYYAKTGVKVAVERRESLDYLGDIYDATMQGEAFPDVYMIAGDDLEEAYLYGLVSVNGAGVTAEGILPNAVTAATYEGKALGYPLSFHTCVFVCQKDYFGEAPASMQAIVDYSNENEPPENVEYLMEWNVNDAYYDFPFVSNSVTFEKTEQEIMQVHYDEERYQEDLNFFATMLNSFSVDPASVSEQGIVDHFKNGRTLSAILDTDFLCQLEGDGYVVMEIPDLNDTLTAVPCAGTDMLAVNDFSEKRETAADFARYVTTDMAGELYALTGHFSAVAAAEPSQVEEVVYRAYANAVLMPDSQDAKEFWVNLEETILKYF